mmetsp:Transcript_118904/g.296649  ORF Transcript_118904/g.296649 Transcript_118904/m.296649 type:complete len:394 (+) Transcript_118904:157-1338(+)
MWPIDVVLLNTAAGQQSSFCHANSRGPWFIALAGPCFEAWADVVVADVIVVRRLEEQVRTLRNTLHEARARHPAVRSLEGAKAFDGSLKCLAQVCDQNPCDAMQRIHNEMLEKQIPAELAELAAERAARHVQETRRSELLDEVSKLHDAHARAGSLAAQAQVVGSGIVCPALEEDEAEWKVLRLQAAIDNARRERDRARADCKALVADLEAVQAEIGARRVATEELRREKMIRAQYPLSAASRGLRDFLDRKDRSFGSSNHTEATIAPPVAKGIDMAMHHKGCQGLYRQWCQPHQRQVANLPQAASTSLGHTPQATQETGLENCIDHRDLHRPPLTSLQRRPEPAAIEAHANSVNERISKKSESERLHGLSHEPHSATAFHAAAASLSRMMRH